MDTSVYIDTDALVGWSADMTNINDNAVQCINDFLENVRKLEESWIGESATSFLSENETFITKAIQQHEQMSDVENFLITVVETMEKE